MVTSIVGFAESNYIVLIAVGFLSLACSFWFEDYFNNRHVSLTFFVVVFTLAFIGLGFSGAISKFLT